MTDTKHAYYYNCYGCYNYTTHHYIIIVGMDINNVMDIITVIDIMDFIGDIRIIINVMDFIGDMGIVINVMDIIIIIIMDIIIIIIMDIIIIIIMDIIIIINMDIIIPIVRQIFRKHLTEKGFKIRMNSKHSLSSLTVATFIHVECKQKIARLSN